MRIGAKKRPFYRVVAVDERSKRTGGYIELLGTYNPLTKPKEIKLKQDRIDYWIKQGAQPSDGYLRIIGKAKQRPPRKAKKVISDGGKKEKKEEPTTPKAEEIKEETSNESELETVKSELEDTQEKLDNTKEEVMDDSAEENKSLEDDKSESVQNKKDEGSA